MIIHNFFFNLLIHYLKVKEGFNAKKKTGVTELVSRDLA